MTPGPAVAAADLRRAAGWERAWRDIGRPHGQPLLLDQLLAAWREPHRHYHTLQHLDECLALFEATREHAGHPGEVALALWFHDAVCEPGAADNEERSAEWARRSITAAGEPAAARRVAALVLGTRHDAPAQSGDAQLVADIDLAILGAPAERFDEYERQVRREYAQVPDAAFRAGRARILADFLARPALYLTPALQARFEAAARANLQRALARLQG